MPLLVCGQGCDLEVSIDTEASVGVEKRLQIGWHGSRLEITTLDTEKTIRADDPDPIAWITTVQRESTVQFERRVRVLVLFRQILVACERERGCKEHQSENYTCLIHHHVPNVPMSRTIYRVGSIGLLAANPNNRNIAFLVKAKHPTDDMLYSIQL